MPPAGSTSFCRKTAWLSDRLSRSSLGGSGLILLFVRTFLCLRRAAVIILQFKYLPRDWDANRKTVTDSISMCMTTLINAAAFGLT